MTEHIITKIANLEINDSKDDVDDVDDMDATTNPIPEGLTDDVDVHPTGAAVDDGESGEINSLDVHDSGDEYYQTLWLTGC